jgi:hypothetical protein
VKWIGMGTCLPRDVRSGTCLNLYYCGFYLDLVYRNTLLNYMASLCVFGCCSSWCCMYE